MNEKQFEKATPGCLLAADSYQYRSQGGTWPGSMRRTWATREGRLRDDDGHVHMAPVIIIWPSARRRHVDVTDQAMVLAWDGRLGFIGPEDVH